jgi:putative flippase GtrA
MFTFIKAQATAITGSILDFLLTILLAEGFHCWYITANMAGNISGGITQFALARNWAFEAGTSRIRVQALRYLAVWCGNILLSATGVYGLTHYLLINYVVSKLIISVLLGISYNYLLQKNFVFK